MAYLLTIVTRYAVNCVLLYLIDKYVISLPVCAFNIILLKLRPVSILPA